MNKLKNIKTYLKHKVLLYGLFIAIISMFCIIYALLLYYGKINSEMKSVNLWTFIIGIVSFLLLGFISGIIAKKNGLLEGLTAGLFIILIGLLLNLFIKDKQLIGTDFIKLATYLTSSAVGGIIGVNIKK